MDDTEILVLPNDLLDTKLPNSYLLKYYEDFAKNNTNITLNTTNNTTVIHFNDDNIIGEINFHDMAISGDNEKYILMQCDNETLMKSMAESIKFQ